MTAIATTTVRESRRRRMLLPLATMLAAAGIAAASGATFSASTATEVNIAAAGTMSLATSNQTIFDFQNMKPGDTLIGDITLTNTGSLGAGLTLTETEVEDTFTPGTLTVSVVDGEGFSWSGDFGNLGEVALADLPAGGARTYTFTVHLLETADDAEQGAIARASYEWDAESLTGEVIDQTASF